MKRIGLFLSLLCWCTLVSAQTFKQPAAGKSMVYFMRLSSLASAVNFKYFDGEQYIGKHSGRNYFSYECDPGEHVFWVTSENRDYIKGDLEPNKTYVMEIAPDFGAFRATVHIYQVDPSDERWVKRVRKLLGKKEEVTLKQKDEDLDYFIETGMKRFGFIEDKVEVINQQWTF